MTRRPMLAITLLGALLLSAAAPRISMAEDAEPETPSGPSLFSYGSRGLWTGAELGLAAGYLATGRVYQSGEWKSLVFGLGIGALSGLGVGIALAITDASAGYPNTGWLVMRDLGYGLWLGAFAGAAVGALAWIDDGRPKYVLNGLAIGSLIGAGVGAVFGVIEGATAKRRERKQQVGALDLHFGVGAVPSTTLLPAVGPMLSGTF